MFKSYHIIFLLFLVILSLQRVLAKDIAHGFRIHTDLPKNNNDKKIQLDIYYETDSSFNGKVNVRFYKYQNETDSVLVLCKRNLIVLFKKGVNKRSIDFSNIDSNTKYSPKFYEILKRTESMPPGSYKVFISVNDSANSYSTIYLHEIDSALSVNSPVRAGINNSLAKKSKSFLGIRFKKTIDNAQSSNTTAAILHARNKIDGAAKKRGLTTLHYEKNNKSYVDLFYQDWFAGRYEVKNNESLSKQISEQNKQAGNGDFKSVSTDDMDHPSLLSQYKTINREKKDRDEIKGEISLTTNVSNGQEQSSAVDNNYAELKGRVDLPICNIPVSIEGLYTTQDNNREIKSSYFRIHYDVNKIKDDLCKSIKSYNSKFEEAKSKGAGMEQLYKSSINNLEGQKTKLQNEINSETNAKKSEEQFNDNKVQQTITTDLKKQEKDTTGLNQVIPNNNDSGKKANNDVTSLKTKAEGKKDWIAQKRKQIDQLNRKINKYKILLAQYENTNHFDSTMGYNKTKGVTDQSGMTYKQMVKKSASILPDGQVKNFMTGITTMDAGMFPKEQSKYTMSGQMVKGLDFGYDLGFCETGLTVGKTQYIGRDGSLDKYTCYSGKASFKLVKAQKICLIYYGYSADHNMLSGDNFFKDQSISAPSFFEPVHIISTKYDASLSKFVTVGAEVAASIQNSDKTDAPAIPEKDKLAYHLDMEGNIPETNIRLEGLYDKTGTGFVNNTLPVSMIGTEQYKLAGKTDFFHSFLTVGIEYDRLIQNNFTSNGTNTKWGFDIKTNSKKYPTISLSYKPFTTFRSYTDTLSIPQRPLIGSVFTAKATYQIRKHAQSLRFSLLYNKNMTTMDTTKSGSTMVQGTCIYTGKLLTTSISVGQMQLTGTNVATITTTPNNTSFLTLSADYPINKQFSVTGGQDIGFALFGFCKYSANGGMIYKLKKSKITTRLNIRYNTYELNAGDPWKRLYTGNLDIMYQFSSKKYKTNNF